MCMHTTNTPEGTLQGAGDWTNGVVDGKKNILQKFNSNLLLCTDQYLDMAFLKDGRSDSVWISSGRFFHILCAKNEIEFVPYLTLLQKGISRVFTEFLRIRVWFRGVIRSWRYGGERLFTILKVWIVICYRRPSSREGKLGWHIKDM